mgnify:CR=1 FL=1
MARSTRIEFAGAWYHVMSRGVARMPTFLDDDDRRAFLAMVGRLVAEGALETHAFCLMPNHYHLLLRTPAGNLARWIRHLNGDYARRFNARHRRVGHVWQGRYKAILVEDGAYLREVSRYIHLNPNRAKITRPAERYPWSSYRNFVGGPAAVDWVETGTLLGEFDGDRAAYRAYVEAGKGEKAVSPFERAHAGLVLGGEAFVRRVLARLAGRRGDVPEPALRAIRRQARPSAEAVDEVVARLFAEVGPARRRRLAMYAERLYSPLRPSEIARRHGRSPAAVTLAVRDLALAARSDAALAAGLESLGRALAGDRTGDGTAAKRTPGAEGAPSLGSGAKRRPRARPANA